MSKEWPPEEPQWPNILLVIAIVALMGVLFLALLT